MKHALALGMLLLCSGCIIVSADIEQGRPLAASPPFYGYEDFVRDGIARNEALMQNFECEYEIAYEKVDDKLPDTERVTRMECRQVRQGEKSYYKAVRHFADGHKDTVTSTFDGKEQRTVMSDNKYAVIGASPRYWQGIETIDQYTNVSLSTMGMSGLLERSEIISCKPTDIGNEFGAIVKIEPPDSTPENRVEMKLVFRVEAGVVPYRMERYLSRQSKDPVEQYEVLDMQGLERGVRVPTKVRAVKYEILNGWRAKRSECIVRTSKWMLNPEIPGDLFLLTIPKDKTVMDLRSESSAKH